MSSSPSCAFNGVKIFLICELSSLEDNIYPNKSWIEVQKSLHWKLNITNQIYSHIEILNVNYQKKHARLRLAAIAFKMHCTICIVFYALYSMH
jgi:hypothetical protein